MTIRSAHLADFKLKRSVNAKNNTLTTSIHVPREKGLILNVTESVESEAEPGVGHSCVTGKYAHTV